MVDSLTEPETRGADAAWDPGKRFPKLDSLVNELQTSAPNPSSVLHLHEPDCSVVKRLFKCES